MSNVIDNALALDEGAICAVQFISEWVRDCHWKDWEIIRETHPEFAEPEPEAIVGLWHQELPENGSALTGARSSSYAIQLSIWSEIEKPLREADQTAFRTLVDSCSVFVVLKDFVIAFYRPGMAIVPIKRTEAIDQTCDLDAMLASSGDPYLDPSLITERETLDPSSQAILESLVADVMQTSRDPRFPEMGVYIYHAVRSLHYERPNGRCRPLDKGVATVGLNRHYLDRRGLNERDAELVGLILDRIRPYGHRAFFSGTCVNRRDNLEHLQQTTEISLRGRTHAGRSSPDAARSRLRRWLSQEGLNASLVDG